MQTRLTVHKRFAIVTHSGGDVENRCIRPESTNQVQPKASDAGSVRLFSSESTRCVLGNSNRDSKEMGLGDGGTQAPYPLTKP